MCFIYCYSHRFSTRSDTPGTSQTESWEDELTEASITEVVRILDLLCLRDVSIVSELFPVVKDFCLDEFDTHIERRFCCPLQSLYEEELSKKKKTTKIQVPRADIERLHFSLCCNF